MLDSITGYPSIDKPWLKYYSEEDHEIKIPECTIYQNIYNHNKDHLNETALLFFGNRISFGFMFSKIEECTKVLRYIGIKRGDCVNLCSASVPEAIYTVLACSRIGAIANFINPMFTTEQMIDRINDTESEWILVLDVMYSYIEKALPDTCVKNVVIIPATNSVPYILSKALFIKSEAKKILKNRNSDDHGLEIFLWNEFIDLGNDFKGTTDDPYEQDTPTVMVYSSGTTGASKGILLTNDGINAFISAYYTTGYSDMAYARGLVFLQMIPIWFSTGIVYSILMPLGRGFTVALEPKFSNKSFLTDLKKYKPSITLAATNMWLYLVDAKADIDLSNMKYPISGGEKMLACDEKRINDFIKRNGCKKRLYKGYGMCELGSEVCGTTDVKNYVDKSGGSGYPILNVLVAAFDLDTDQELKYGEHGEIRVCTPLHMKGYYKNPQATDEFFKTDSEGRVWGCTGDVGYVDKDGEIFILGRAKDSCRSNNGELIYLFDIEEEIFKDETVNQCKVVDIIEDGILKLVAHIVFRDEVTDIDSRIKQIKDHLAETLPEYKRPYYYKIRKSMPINKNGKRDIIALRSDVDGLVPF